MLRIKQETHNLATHDTAHENLLALRLLTLHYKNEILLPITNLLKGRCVNWLHCAIQV